MISDAGIARLLADLDRDALADNERKTVARRCAGCGRETGSGLSKCGLCWGREISERRAALRAAGRKDR